MAAKPLATNRRARFDYTLIDEYTAGIVLAGHEVKSVRHGGASLKGAYVTISVKNEAWLTNAHIRKYDSATTVQDYDPNQARKLLLNRKEIDVLSAARNNELTIVPLSIFIAGNRIKLRIATARGKKLHDKRHDIKRRDTERQERRAFNR